MKKTLIFLLALSSFSAFSQNVIGFCGKKQNLNINKNFTKATLKLSGDLILINYHSKSGEQKIEKISGPKKWKFFGNTPSTQTGFAETVSDLAYTEFVCVGKSETGSGFYGAGKTLDEAIMNFKDDISDRFKVKR